MMPRTAPLYRRKIGIALGVFLFGAVAILAVYIAWYTQVHFFIYQDRVDAVLANLPPGEANPPSLLSEIVHRVEGKHAVYFVARNLVAETHGKPMRMIDWHVTNALWSGLLPLRLSQRDITALYGHFMVFEGGRGLNYGARRYFGKAPTDLTLDEMLGLLAISRAPFHYSPERQPENYRRQLERLRSEYQHAANSD